MARRPRLHFPGAIYHVTLTGNGNQPVFLDDVDRTRFLLLIQEGIEKFDHQVHAYCLLPTCLRLVVEVNDVPLSRIMQQLGFRYTRWFNDWHGQIGHLFQGRYQALLIDPESYLLPLVADLHLAPVRADQCADPIRYPWSSHRAYCGREKVIWLATERTLLQIEETGIRALMKFHTIVNEGLEQQAAQVDFSHGGVFDPRVLGSEEFVRGVMRLARQKFQPKPRPEKVIQTVLDHYGLSRDELAAPGKNRQAAEARAYLAWLFLETGCATLSSLGGQLRRDVSSLSSAARRLQLRGKQDESVGQLLTGFLKRIGA